ncbi:MAG: RICIN domain-containing protein [Bacillota bacterium]|nr:RICIN domain-containing protein [Bacillota bacterium]
MKKITSVFIALSLISGVVVPISAYDSLDRIQEKSEKETSKLTNGIYSIDTRINGLSLEPGIVSYTGEEAVLTNAKENKDSQKWVLSEVSKGAFAIVSAIDGRALGVEYKEDLDEARVVLSDYENSINQKWVFKKTDDGFYTIHSCISSDYVLQYGNPKGIMLSKSTKNIYQTFKVKFERATFQPSEIESSIEKVHVDSQSSDKGSFSISVEGVESNAMVSGLKIEVIPKGKKKKSKVYYYKSEGETDFYKTIRAVDFDYLSGKYQIKLSLILDGVYESEIGTYTCDVSDPYAGMEKRIQNMISENTNSKEIWQVSFMDLKRNKEININSNKNLSMNLIKLFVMGAIYNQIDSFDRDVVEATVKDMMITDSDIAMGDIFSILGNGDYKAGAEVVTNWANEQGYEDVYASTLYTENKCSAINASQFLKDLSSNKYAYSEEMLSILEQAGPQKIITSVIPNTVKTGSKAGVMNYTVNDSAIIYSANGDYVLTVMATGVSSPSNSQGLIQSISKEFYNFLND